MGATSERPGPQAVSACGNRRAARRDGLDLCHGPAVRPRGRGPAGGRADQAAVGAAARPDDVAGAGRPIAGWGTTATGYPRSLFACPGAHPLAAAGKTLPETGTISSPSGSWGTR